MNVAGESQHSHPGLFVGGINGCVLRRESEPGLKDLEECQAQEHEDPDRYSHLRNGESGLGNFVKWQTFHWSAVRIVSIETL